MANRKIVEAVYEKVSNCIGCRNHCPCKALSCYIDEIGIDEFVEQLESDSLPKYIRELFDQKRNQLNI